MPALSREGSRERDLVVKHQHSWSHSENSRSNIPMWDSSDPDRAPPPLPMNPGSISPTTKPNTSSAIAAAAAKFTESARAAAPLSSYTRNSTPQPESSPERSLIRGAHHKRMQTFSSNSVKDLRAYLDSNRKDGHERSIERPVSGGSLTPYASKENIKPQECLSPSGSSADKSDFGDTPTPTRQADPLRDAPDLRPTMRQRSIYGESTPPSATMLALQTMQVPDPFNDVTNTSATNGPSTPSAGPPPRVHTNYDFASQLLNLTSIATGLQKEMAQLSRRSKDNATDLISLKEATTARDEDIRKSLRDLSSAWSTTQNLLEPPPKINADTAGGRSRSTSSFAASHFIDNKAFFSSPPSASKTFTMPRAASAHSFLDDARELSPSPWSVEGAASVAMLEKIIREMVTKEGQERLLSTLSELFEQSSKDNVEAAKKVEQLADFIKQKSESQALVSSSNGNSRLDIDSPRTLSRTVSADTVPQKADMFAESEFAKILQRIKDSVLHTGGTTHEVKNIVRDLRGEVLGMGRELGRKLDQVSEVALNNTLDRSIENQSATNSTEEIQQVIDDSMAELKDHIVEMLQQQKHERDMQVSTFRSPTDSNETYEIVKAALAEHANQQLVRSQPQGEGLDRESILDTVKEGLKDFEPNIELQQYGLERDEILVVLKEGFDEHTRARMEESSPQPVASFDKAEVFEAVREALGQFNPPAPIIEPQLQQMRDEILASVQQVLSEFQPPLLPNAAVDNESIVAAVRECLAEHGPNAPREIEISRDDLFDAVKASLDGSAIPFGGLGEQVLAQLRELVDDMKTEFKQYSAASGRDTEQVLDAVKDGLESLRAEIESYVDRAQDVTGKDEIVDTVKLGLEQLRTDVKGFVAKGPEQDEGKREMLDYIRAEFEHLHEALGTSRDAEGEKPNQTAEIILAIKAGMDALSLKLDTRTSEREEQEEDREEMMEAMKEEFEQLKASILNASNSDKNELVETIQESMGALHAKLNGSELSPSYAASNNATEDAMREQFAELKEMLHATGTNDADREALLDAVRDSIEGLRTQLAGDQGDALAEAIGTIKAELEAFKESMGSSLVPSGSSRSLDVDEDGNNQIIDTLKAELESFKHSIGSSLVPADSASEESLRSIRSALEELKGSSLKEQSAGPVPTELLEAIRGEFENLRNHVSSSAAHNSSNEEVLDAVRLGLDDLRSDMQKKLDNPELGMNRHNELLDALNEGLEGMKGDVIKPADHPMDMTVNYEILDTLKDGIASLRADMERLRSGNADAGFGPTNNAVVLAEPGTEGETSREMPVPEPAASSNNFANADLEKMEVLLAQLQIKVEAMDHTLQEMPERFPQVEPQAFPEGLAVRDDVYGLEALVKEVQESLAELSAREPMPPPPPEGCATKEDTDAIETILRNTKAHLEELQMPDTEVIATKEQVENLEGAVRLAHDTIDSIHEKVENTVATKDDVAVVEVLAQDMKIALDELKSKFVEPESDEVEKAEGVTKADLDVLGLICTEIKTKLDEMTLPEAAEALHKADFEQLQGLVVDFRDSHDKMKESYENDIAITAKAFDDRKQESDALTEQVAAVKTYLEEVKEELLTKIGDGDNGLDTLGETLKSMEEKIPDVEPLKGNVEELLAKLGEEFERSHGSLEAIKADHAQSAESALEKQAEHKVAVVDELGAKLDTLFDGLMSKYDDAQTSAEANIKETQEKIAAQQELMDKTNAMADELRLSIDTLGGTLTMFCDTFPSKMEAMEEQSRTNFEKTEETCNKLDDVHTNLVVEHQGTRERVDKVLAAIDGVQADLTDHNPRVMVKLEELAAIIGQHYEHSQKYSDHAEQHSQSVRDLQEQIRSLAEDSRTQNEGLWPQFEELKSNISGLPALLPPPPEPAQPAPEKYDDAAPETYDDGAVHEKLDQLMGHAQDASAADVQLERLDQIHEKVMATATEVSAFMAMQTKQIMNDHESKEREAEEVAMLLERRNEQRDHLDAEIAVMKEEKEALFAAIEQMKAEREALSGQKTQLRADVSSLETALHIRRDELHEMDSKAEAIERRMLEGVMNQSRMLLLAKAASKPSAPVSPKKKPGRDLRAPSNASERTATSTVPPLRNAHNMAMRSRGQQPAAGSNATERRIMSLNQINNNVPTGAHAYKSLVPTGLKSTANNGMKRSHSVKSQYFQRKASWGAAKRMSLGVQDKENDILSEEDEDEGDYRPLSRNDSEAGTERRRSYASGTGSVMTYDTGSRIPGPTETDLSYGTGSYMTGSELDRRTSLGSTVNGHVDGLGGEDEMLSDHEMSDDEEEEAVLGAQEPLQLEGPDSDHDEEVEQGHHKAVYAPPSDSGLGTDLPTATIASADGDYFR
ncbi:hypothetical protein K431DRAFT_336962 [Polychaeton citri CBS 116435]|uniref:Uncharacterized protein n=1 Tax=Polychaeton citri CBS 116435 TaxID=1314669 RepID=A0A9P4UT52_9PEZI|nr:hypothetical protein K431DRAFT_336962 [Polychaeton citri CBS 116435]